VLKWLRGPAFVTRVNPTGIETDVSFRASSRCPIDTWHHLGPRARQQSRRRDLISNLPVSISRKQKVKRARSKGGADQTRRRRIVKPPDRRPRSSPLSPLDLSSGGRVALRAAVALHLGLEVDIGNSSEGIVFVRDQKRLVFLWRDRAAPNPIYGGGTIWGDFLKPGDHWDRLRDLLLEHGAVEPSSRDRPAAVLVLESLPATLSVEQRAGAVKSSERIRIDRARAFDRRAIIEIGDEGHAQIGFDPIRRSEAGPEAPFRYTRTGNDPIEAALRLGGPDPLPVAAFDEMREADLAEAWVIALAAFADLTCFGDARSVTDRATGPRASKPGRIGPTHPAAPSIPRRRRRLGSSSESLSPLGHAAGRGVSYVCGHRRHLSRGGCGPEALRIALDMGIELRPGETWVRSHVRGLPPDVALEFRWRPPAYLAAAVHHPR
jgi:hypothetical protein